MPRGVAGEDVEPPLELRDAEWRAVSTAADGVELHRFRVEQVSQLHRHLPPLQELLEPAESLAVQLVEPLQERKHEVELAERQHGARHCMERPLHVQAVLQVELELAGQRDRAERGRRELQLPLRGTEHRCVEAEQPEPLVKRVEQFLGTHAAPQPRAPRGLPAD